MTRDIFNLELNVVQGALRVQTVAQLVMLVPLRQSHGFCKALQLLKQISFWAVIVVGSVCLDIRFWELIQKY